MDKIEGAFEGAKTNMTESRANFLLRNLPTTDPVKMAYLIAKLEEEINYYRKQIQMLTDRDACLCDKLEKLVNYILEEKYISGHGFADFDKDLMKDAGISETFMNAFVENKKAEEANPE